MSKPFSLGVFDSGYGGLTIVKEIQQHLPGLPLVYLGDNARAPYGSRTEEEIFQFTLEGVEFLFAEGCDLVILACNTASANALRRIQQEILPKHHPDKRVLGILVPTIEEMTGVSWHEERVNESAPETVAVLATSSTVASGAYLREVTKRRPSTSVVQVACPLLVPHIEKGDEEAVRKVLREYTDDLKRQMDEQELAWPPDVVLLGCTHYALIEEDVRELLPAQTTILGQGTIVAKSLGEYLRKHRFDSSIPEVPAAPVFYTTGNPTEVSRRASTFLGEDMDFYHVILSERSESKDLSRDSSAGSE